MFKPHTRIMFLILLLASILVIGCKPPARISDMLPEPPPVESGIRPEASVEAAPGEERSEAGEPEDKKTWEQRVGDNRLYTLYGMPVNHAFFKVEAIEQYDIEARIQINVDDRLEKQHRDIAGMLVTRFGENSAEDMVHLIKSKTDSDQAIDDTFFVIDGLKILVRSQAGSNLVDVVVYSE